MNVHELFVLEVMGEVEGHCSSCLWWGVGADPLRAGEGSCVAAVQKLLCVSEDAEIHGLEVIPSS